MNSINCSECGHTISTWATRCPGCRRWRFAWLTPVATLALGLSIVMWMAR